MGLTIRCTHGTSYRPWDRLVSDEPTRRVWVEIAGRASGNEVAPLMGSEGRKEGKVACNWREGEH